MEAPSLAPVTSPDDDSRYYPYPPTGELLTSVTFAIGATDYKPWKPKWYASMSARWCVANLVELARTIRVQSRELAEAGKDNPRERARKAAVKLAEGAAKRERDLKADAGTHVHNVAKALIAWAKTPDGGLLALPEIPEHLEGAWYDLGNGEDRPLADVVHDMEDGFQNFVHAFGDSMEIAASEMTVYNVELGYAGTLDLIIILHGYAISHGTGPGGSDRVVACPGGRLVVVVDAKTGKAAEGTWKEQLAAYIFAPECADRLGQMFTMPEADAGMVLHLRPDYPDGWNLYLVSGRDTVAAFERFKKSLSILTERQAVKGKPGTAVRPLRADGTMPGPRLCDVGAEGWGRAIDPLRKALGFGTELEEIAAFTAAELLAVRGIGPKLIETTREMLAAYSLHLAGEQPAAAGRRAAA